MRALWTLAVALLAGCAAAKPLSPPVEAPPCAPIGNKLNLSVLADIARAEFSIYGFTSHYELCKQSDVPLDEEAVKDFFVRARPYDSRTIHDHFDVVECRLEGALQLGGKSCRWWIMPTHVGAIECEPPEAFVVCASECGNLFDK
jgi:hypothetical protein